MFDLYILESCPYCRKVMDFLDKNNITCNKKNISDKENREQLIRLGGYEQVPFLHDSALNINMYESDDIIKYIESKV